SRSATPGAFCVELENAIEQARQRSQATTPVRWEIGRHSRTGRTKLAFRMANEDFVLVRNYTGPERALAVVADGITTCHIGSGALASLMTCLVLENAFTQG